ncbi:MAG: putative rane protein [Ramlibacter sp.]|jgi:GGDEF domain-containing protein|uniref:GGDEF domain-containing protein n=1 Tax=Ramlibacter sp. TaxID=1917967 RepID=UPI00261B4B44|nr:GGDEF domain-containing protein [Ramlibacter sp.]MDB5751604.1 putative rane protein [Ramlibacter sp.]
MDPLAAGFWGAFFGTAALMLVVSLIAYARSHKRVALMAGLSAAVSAAFVVSYLGWLPIAGPAEARVLAHVAMLSAGVLALMLLAMLGLLRGRALASRAFTGMLALASLVIAVGWALAPAQALALSSLVAFGIGLLMLVIALRRALRGDRLAWVTVSGVSLMLVALGGLSTIALDRTSGWPVHAVSAIAGMAYLAVMASALWGRYSYLLELSEVMRHGPSYDPVTRMRSHSETGQMVGDMFFRHEGGERPIGVIAICIANLYALENLHGRAAFNHALFIYAGRLRRCVPQVVEMGRLGDDGFLLMVRNAGEMQQLVQLARTVRQRLARPVALSTSRDVAGLERAGTAWVAEVGIGVLGTSTGVRPSQAISTARAMARTAWSYGSRLAFFDQQLGRIAELPLDDNTGHGQWLATAY